MARPTISKVYIDEPERSKHLMAFYKEADAEPKAVNKCDRCGQYLVWVESARTGKWYLAECRQEADVWLYEKHVPHLSERCDERYNSQEEPF